MRYFVMIRRTGTGYSVDVPDVPGCVSTGLTVEDARQQIAEALEVILSSCMKLAKRFRRRRHEQISVLKKMQAKSFVPG